MIKKNSSVEKSANVKPIKPETKLSKSKKTIKETPAVIVRPKNFAIASVVYNKQGYLGGDSNPALTYPKASTPKMEAFYGDIHDLLVNTRNGCKIALNKIKSILRSNQLTANIRSNSLKSDGVKRENGEDEVFKTSETKKWIERSAEMIKDKSATSHHYNNVCEEIKFDWVDVQKDVRHPTQHRLYNSGGAHSGALYRAESSSLELSSTGKSLARSGILAGQYQAHKERNDEILRSSTPRNAVMRALRADLKSSPNSENFDDTITQGFDYKDRDMSDPKQKRELKNEYLLDRNRVKKTYNYFKNETYNFDNTSEVSDYELSSEDNYDPISDSENIITEVICPKNRI
jgi:hypothetical protein